MTKKELVEELIRAKKNYRGAIRWYREVLAYRNTVKGDEWKPNGSWIVQDAETAYGEVVQDIIYFRKKINKYTDMLNKISGDKYNEY